MVTGPVPVELIVTLSVTGVFTVKLPKAKLAGPTLSVSTGTFNSRAKVSVTVPALAVSVTACAIETGEKLAVNWALVSLAWINAAGDTVTAALLLDRPTLNPAAGAGSLMVTVQRSVPVPPIDALTHEIPLSCGAGGESAAPVPLRLIRVAPVEALLEMLNFPLAGPAATGTNATFKLYDPPAAIEIGRLFCPGMANDCPVRLTWVMFTETELPLTRETAVLALFPTGTLPRMTAFGETTIA
jgi:hypothetical protein